MPRHPEHGQRQRRQQRRPNHHQQLLNPRLGSSAAPASSNRGRYGTPNDANRTPGCGAAPSHRDRQRKRGQPQRQRKPDARASRRLPRAGYPARPPPQHRPIPRTESAAPTSPKESRRPVAARSSAQRRSRAHNRPALALSRSQIPVQPPPGNPDRQCHIRQGRRPLDCDQQIVAAQIPNQGGELPERRTSNYDGLAGVRVGGSA